MAKQWIMLIAIGLLFFPALAATQAQTGTEPQTIHILPDGTVTPATAPIHQNGDFYKLTDNIDTPIIVERNNITLDGRGFTVQGNGEMNNRAAINLTCMGVTVENFQFNDWQVGVLGAYDNNRIVSNSFSGVTWDIAVYGNNYEVTQNHMDYMRIQGSNVHVYKNEIQIQSYGSAFWITNSTNITIEANNVKTGEMITSFISTSGGSTMKVFHNNFFNADNVQFDKGEFYMFGMSGLSDLDAWDDGYPSGGNYWSDYTARYSNASTVGDSGVWNTPYLIQAEYMYNLVDRYPLVKPYNVQVAALPTPPPAGSIEDNPTPSVPELPIWAMLMLFATVYLVIVSLKREYFRK
jgi:hypothetical protein